MIKFIKEFKEFAVKGNMIDMAVGVIIGTAFNKVVSTLVNKVIMPPLSLLTDDVHFADKQYVLRKGHGEIEEIALGYGALIEVLIDFLIISLTIFMVVKFINRFKAKAEDPKNKDVATPRNIELLANMEKLLQEQNELIKQRSK
ncbi:large-conductance mechanosensitive channel protein MscL [Arenibacter certesii]|uniref:Large-conductance mechanosensitive channel n=1 Tax=Arenibacter certesii TaxID=228955 RepID=A0A918MIQ7_9FLAO|nr:large-conductance mechanosensitive channel protein MscL [Arenibacter certesii]GGW25811.1 large-conductance mechanosensitive channel [Arenibacter certesii]